MGPPTVALVGGLRQALLEFDPDTLRRTKRIPFSGRGLWAIAAGGGSIWVAGDSDRPRSGRSRTIPVGSPDHATTCGIAATNDAVWITVGGGGCDINAQ